MAGVVDTNILLYAANRDAPEYEQAASFLATAGRSADPWYLTEGICYEFLRVATHPRVFGEPLTWTDAISFLTPMLASSRFSVLNFQAGMLKVLPFVVLTTMFR